jgi:hypothetical protein
MTRVQSPASLHPLELQIQDTWKQIAARAGRILNVEREPGAHTLPVTGRPCPVPNGWAIAFDTRETYRVIVRGDVVYITLPRTPGEHELLRLAGPVTSLVIATCGFFPLHAAAFRLPEGIVAVFAPPGRGKSTLAALGATDGLEILGDDLIALTRAGTVLPVTGSLRITPTEAPSGWHPAAMLPDGRGWYPLPRANELTSLRALLLLERGTSAALSSIGGQQRLAAMREAGYLSRFAARADSAGEETLGDIIAAVPMWRLHVPDGVEAMRDAWREIRMLLVEACG